MGTSSIFVTVKVESSTVGAVVPTRTVLEAELIVLLTVPPDNPDGSVPSAVSSKRAAPFVP